MHIYSKQALLENSPSIDMSLTNKHLLTFEIYWENNHTTRRSHTNTHVPIESPAGVIHIKFTLTDQFNNKERNHTHHTASRSGYISKTEIHHNTLHLLLLLHLDRYTKYSKG